MSGPAEPRPSKTLAALAGLVGAALALGMGELLAGLAGDRVPSLVVAVGDLVIDVAPTRLVKSGIETLGTADKPALVAGIVGVSLLIGALVGLGAVWQRGVAAPVFGASGAFGVLAAVRDPITEPGWALVTGAGAVLAGLTGLWSLLAVAERLGGRLARAEVQEGRRTFLGLATTGLALAAGTTVLGRSLARRMGVEAARADVALPVPRRRGPPLGGTLDDVGGVTPYVTPNRVFYRIDTAIVAPQVDPDDWSLRVTGLVERPFEIGFDELLALPMVEEHVTLVCVSNEVGGGLVGNARWLGVPLRDLLDRARPGDGATQIVGRSVDRFTVGFPLEVAYDGRPALVAVGMNGEPLPVTHGFPARLVVSGLYGYVSATKWLTEIELTRYEDFDAYWVPRGWAKEAPVKTQARIDTPRSGRVLQPGPVAVAGVAWAMNRGVSRVEVRVDGGNWREAELGAASTDNTWRQWLYRWDASPGRHMLTVRATDGTGAVQPAARRSPAPDGATGHHGVRVSVEGAEA